MKNTNKNRTRKNKIPGNCCETTFHGLNKWYKSMFENLGWMVLAKERGMTDKVKAYLNSIYRIHIAIHQKIKSTFDKDRIQDLEIMGDNIKVLLAHVQKDFKQ
jgi:hypothetical protein